MYQKEGWTHRPKAKVGVAKAPLPPIPEEGFRSRLIYYRVSVLIRTKLQLWVLAEGSLQPVVGMRIQRPIHTFQSLKKIVDSIKPDTSHVSCLDFVSGYFQGKIAIEFQPLTTFISKFS